MSNKQLLGKMIQNKFLTENARITDAYSRMYSRDVCESAENGDLKRSLRGSLPIDGKGSSRTGSKLGIRKVLPFEKRDAKNTCGHSIPMKRTFGSGRKVLGNVPAGRSVVKGEMPSGTGSKLGVRKVLPFEKRDERPTSIGRISSIRDVSKVSKVKGVHESDEDFEIDSTELDGGYEVDCEQLKDILELVLTTFDQIYDNLSDDDKDTVDEVRAEIENVLNPDDDSDDFEDDGGEDETEDVSEYGFEEDDIGESFVNEAGPSKKPSPKKSPKKKSPKKPDKPPKKPDKPPKGIPNSKYVNNGKLTAEGWKYVNKRAVELEINGNKTPKEARLAAIREISPELARHKEVVAFILKGAGAASGVAATVAAGNYFFGGEGDKDKPKKEGPEAGAKQDVTAVDRPQDAVRTEYKDGTDTGQSKIDWAGLIDAVDKNPALREKLGEFAYGLGQEHEKRLGNRKSSDKSSDKSGGEDGIITQLGKFPGNLVGGLIGGTGEGIGRATRGIRSGFYGVDDETAREEARQKLAIEKSQKEWELEKQKREYERQQKERQKPIEQPKSDVLEPPDRSTKTELDDTPQSSKSFVSTASGASGASDESEDENQRGVNS